MLAIVKKMYFIAAQMFCVLPVLAEVTNLRTNEREQNMYMWELRGGEKPSFTSNKLHCRREERLRTCSMNESGHYPPPDFSGLSSNTTQYQQQPRSSSFHSSMWSWSETPSEPSWDHSGPAGWHHGAAAGFGFQSGRGNYGPKRPYGKLPIKYFKW